jgi:hypothetical protein
MLGILADVNAEGHVDLLLRTLVRGDWIDFWNEWGLAVFTLEDLGLTRDA